MSQSRRSLLYFRKTKSILTFPSFSSLLIDRDLGENGIVIGIKNNGVLKVSHFDNQARQLNVDLVNFNNEMSVSEKT